MDENLSGRKLDLHSADFSWFELRRYAMKGKSEGNFQHAFLLYTGVSAHMFLLQASGVTYSVTVTMNQKSQPDNSKTQQKMT